MEHFFLWYSHVETGVEKSAMTKLLLNGYHLGCKQEIMFQLVPLPCKVFFISYYYSYAVFSTIFHFIQCLKQYIAKLFQTSLLHLPIPN